MKRELNEIEYFNWCVEQPYNMVAAVRIRGGVTALDLRAALDKAQRRHPLLGVNTEIGSNGLPYFASEGVGPIPLAIVDAAAAQAAGRLFDTELATGFERDRSVQPRLPLMRVSLLLPAEPKAPADVVFTVQHVIGDGLSLAYLVRDLLHFMEEPDAPVTVLDAPASADELFPANVRRRLPKSARLFEFVLHAVRFYAKIRGPLAAPAPGVRAHAVWTLSREQTARLRARCRQERVSVQSAVSTAFFREFPWIHTPVNLRPLLARPVAESFGLYVGAAEVRLRYRRWLGFWQNARRCQRRLRAALRDPFGVFRLFSKVVPSERVRELGPLLVRLGGKARPFAVTNLGDLDARGIAFHGARFALESFYGAVSGIVDSSVLTAYTLEGALRLHFLASETSADDTTLRDAAGRAVKALLDAMDQ
jgi:hypothetical protein